MENKLEGDWVSTPRMHAALAAFAREESDELAVYAASSPLRCIAADRHSFVLVRRHKAHISSERLHDANVPPRDGEYSIPCVNLYTFAASTPSGWWLKLRTHPEIDFESVRWTSDGYRFRGGAITDRAHTLFGRTFDFTVTTQQLKRTMLQRMTGLGLSLVDLETNLQEILGRRHR